MEENPQVRHLSRSQLDCLSTGELIKLADNCGIDIPIDLERIFIIEELLEYSNAEKQDTADDIEVNPSYPETAELPKQYNISFIEVVIRDPLWVFVFWEVKGQDKETHENTNDFNGYCLRVVPLNDGETESQSMENSFTVPVDANDSARYLGFAEHTSKAQGRYKINLCVLRGNTEVNIASSVPFCLPMLIEDEYINEIKESPLVRLSGIQDLSITKSTDRQSRSKRP